MDVYEESEQTLVFEPSSIRQYGRLIEAFELMRSVPKLHKLAHWFVCSLNFSDRHLSKCSLEKITTTIDCR